MDKEPSVRICCKQYVKVYRPALGDAASHMQGILGENYCFGLGHDLPASESLLFIAGSEKDVMSLTVHGVPCCLLQFQSSGYSRGELFRLKLSFSVQTYCAALLMWTKRESGQFVKTRTGVEELRGETGLLPMAELERSGKRIFRTFRLGK